MNRIRSLYYNIIYGIRNILAYFKIVWTDRDWDYEYLLDLMAFKIKRMRRLFKKHGHLVNRETNIKYLGICEKLIDLLITESKEFEDVREQFKYYNKCKRLLFKIMDTQLYRWWD